MKKRQLFFALALAASLGLAAVGSAAEKNDAAPRPDNTKVNKEHKEMSADQQAENPADRKMTQEIRRIITKDKSLSQYAHNVKIITRNGAVTLKGPVRSEKEKMAVEKAAQQVAGKGKVTNEIEIAPAKSDKHKEKSKEKDQDKTKEKSKE